MAAAPGTQHLAPQPAEQEPEVLAGEGQSSLKMTLTLQGPGGDRTDCGVGGSWYLPQDFLFSGEADVSEKRGEFPPHWVCPQ